MTLVVKVCGLRTAEAAEVAVEAGADAIGVVFSQKSPRRVTEDEARAVIDAVAGRATTVVVTNDLDPVEAGLLAKRIGADVLQLHGRYNAGDYRRAADTGIRLWRATALRDDTDLRVGAWGEEALLLDAPKPGSGERWDLTALASRQPDGPWLLAGGLNPDNVADAIAQARPWGVDVSSGVESEPGVKDLDKIREFVAAARAAHRASSA